MNSLIYFLQSGHVQSALLTTSPGTNILQRLQSDKYKLQSALPDMYARSPRAEGLHTIQVDLLASRKFGELVSNRCWCYFNLVKSCSCYTYNSYEAILASFKFGGRTKNRQTAKLKSPPNIPRIRYKAKHSCPTNMLHLWHS